jgi:hypothetical protein
MKPTSNLGQEKLAHALRSCPVLCKELGPQGLACLATSSIYCRTAAVEAVCKEKRDLLASALDTAHSTGLDVDVDDSEGLDVHVHLQAVAWLAGHLLRQEPETAADVAEQLLTLPKVPLSMAKQLLSAGMRISYEQLLAAASSMVKGVEVWVQAQQLLNITSDIPNAAVAICCGGNWVSGARCIRLATALHSSCTQCDSRDSNLLP